MFHIVTNLYFKSQKGPWQMKALVNISEWLTNLSDYIMVSEKMLYSVLSHET